MNEESVLAAGSFILLAFIAKVNFTALSPLSISSLILTILFVLHIDTPRTVQGLGRRPHCTYQGYFGCLALGTHSGRQGAY